MRVSETACPFCAAPLDMDQRAATAQAVTAGLPTRRMGRAALLAIGLGIVAPLTQACSSDDDSTDNETHDGGVTPAYGAPSVDAGIDASIGPAYGIAADAAAFPDGGVVAAYGAPFFDSGTADASDSGEEADAADASDASSH